MRKKILFPAALLLLVFSFVLSLCVGSAQISIREAVSALQNGSLTPDSRILFYVRLPRALPPCSRAQHLRSPACSYRMS